MKIKNVFPLLCVLFLTSSMVSCLYDELEEPFVPLSFTAWCDSIQPTFTEHVMPIIAQSCAYNPTCHPNYTNYNTITNKINNGSFEDRVFTQASNPSLGMPPNSTVYPESIKDDLTAEELDIIRCWLDRGFPE